MSERGQTVLERRVAESTEELHYVRQLVAYERAINKKGKLKRNHEVRHLIPAQSPNLAE